MMNPYKYGSTSVCVCEEYHLIDVELWLASGHFSVAGAELADKVVAVKTNTQSHFSPTEKPTPVPVSEKAKNP